MNTQKWKKLHLNKLSDADPLFIRQQQTFGWEDRYSGKSHYTVESMLLPSTEKYQSPQVLPSSMNKHARWGEGSAKADSAQEAEIIEKKCLGFFYIFWPATSTNRQVKAEGPT